MKNNIFSILFSILLITIIYCLVMIIIKFKESSKYIYKVKNLNFKEKLYNKSSFYSIKKFILTNLNYKVGKFKFSPVIIIFISLVLSFIMFISSYKVLQIISSSVILSLYMFVLPYQIIKFLKIRTKQKIMSELPTYLATLKNYTKTENDIVIAFRKANPSKELEPYILKFNNKVENGVKIFDAFEELKFDIGIAKISEFITALQYCYMNGGDFTALIDKYLKIIVKLGNQREDEKEKSLGTRLVLLVLIVINVYMLFGFVFANPEYKLIITQSFIGKLIVNIDILFYIVIFIIFSKMSEMEE